MKKEEIIALAKEKLGKEITEQEVQEYLDGNCPLPDEVMELVSGSGCNNKPTYKCPRCYSIYFSESSENPEYIKCRKCGLEFYKGAAIGFTRRR